MLFQTTGYLRAIRRLALVLGVTGICLIRLTAAVFYPDRSIAWVGDDTFVPHFLTAFRRPRIPASLYVGKPVTSPDGTTLCRICHRSIAQALATWEKADMSTGQPLL